MQLSGKRRYAGLSSRMGERVRGLVALFSLCIDLILGCEACLREHSLNASGLDVGV